MKWSAWVLGPMVAAAAVAYFGPADDAPSAPDTSPFGDGGAAAAAEAQVQAAQKAIDKTWSADGSPPVDTWANLSECQAWAGGGECERMHQIVKGIGCGTRILVASIRDVDSMAQLAMSGLGACLASY